MWFGVRWSLVGCSLTLITLASCAYIIPEDKNPPRHNQVVGERRVPEGNRNLGDAPAIPQAPMMQTPMVAPQMPPAVVPQDPPSETAPFVTQLPASPQVAPMRPAAPPPPRGWFTRNFDWLPFVGEETPAPAPLPMRTNAAESMDFPALQDTLPTPSTDTQQRLNAAQNELQAQQLQADMARQQLSQEAGAEPSLVPQYASPAVTPPASAAPPLQPPSAAPAQGQISSTLPPLPELALPSVSGMNFPAPAPYTVPSAQAVPVPMPPVAPTIVPPAPEPIVLRPPATAPAGTLSGPKVVSPNIGDPAPITVRPPASAPAGTGYMPDSRYTPRRTHSGN